MKSVQPKIQNKNWEKQPTNKFKNIYNLNLWLWKSFQLLTFLCPNKLDTCFSILDSYPLEVNQICWTLYTPQSNKTDVFLKEYVKTKLAFRMQNWYSNPSHQTKLRKISDEMVRDYMKKWSSFIKLSRCKLTI